ncbi:MAG: type II toxin-antitoxin system RelE/ParE family toxin [Minisyncoccota bacterium]
MKVVFSKDFKKQYKKLSKSLQNKVLARLEIFINDEFDPILNNHKLHSPWDGDRSINITGDMRLVYSKMNDGVCLLITVGSHSKLYK